MSGFTVPTRSEVEEPARRIMHAHWRPPGFTVPNPDVYPAQFLWDSCFHAVVWAALGRADRAEVELTNLFRRQATDGFVPHMTYWDQPDVHAEFWGRSHTSSITQPPMYGHALAELTRAGVAVADDLVAAAEAGLRHLVVDRPRPGGRIAIVHPWESGCDDSPRWDSWCPGGWSASRWKARKGDLVASLTVDATTGSPRGNPAFEVGSAAFAALVAFNIAELASATARPLDPALTRFVDDLDLAVTPSAVGSPTVADVVEGRPAPPSSLAATSEALLGALVDPAVAAVAFDQLLDPSAFGGDHGPATVHRAEAAFDPAGYWRGPAWPQLTYLFWVAARRAGRAAVASALADRLAGGAVRSGFAEYWDVDDGRGLGARPQSWTALAVVVSDR